MVDLEALIDDFTPGMRWSQRERETALDRMLRFAARREWHVEEANRAATPGWDEYWDDVLRCLLERESKVGIARDFHAFFDHVARSGITLAEHFLAEDWAPPSERACLEALGSSSFEPFEVLGRDGSALRLRSMWTGTRVSAELRHRSVGLAPIVAGRIVDDGFGNYLEFDVLEFPACMFQLLQNLADDASLPHFWRRYELPSARVSRVHWAWCELLEQSRDSTSKWGGTVESHQFRARIAGGGIGAAKLFAAGFMRVAGSYWCEANSYGLEAGLVSLRLRRDSVRIGGPDAAAVLAAGERLASRCGDGLVDCRHRIRIDERYQFAFDEDGDDLPEGYRPEVVWRNL